MGITIGLVSYSTAAVLFCTLALYLIVSWRGALDRALLVLAVVATEVWSATAAYYEIVQNGVPYSLHFLELVRDLMWIVFLARTLVFRYPVNDPTRDRLREIPTAAGIVCLVMLLLYIYQYLNNDIPVTAFGIEISLLGYVVLATAALMVIERLIRGAFQERRTMVRLMFIGIGGVFAYDLFMYMQAIFTGGVSSILWEMRGVANAMCVPFLVLAPSQQRPRYSREIYVTHQVVVNISILFAAVIYAFVLGFVAYIVRKTGGGWSSVGEVVLLLGGGLVLASLLFSRRLRSYVKVTVSKHFFNYKYDYREEWLRFIRTLSKGGAGAHLLERAIQSIAQIVDSPGGALWLNREGDRYDLVATWGDMDNRGPAVVTNPSLIKFLEHSQWVIDIQEFKNIPSRYKDLTLSDEFVAGSDNWLIVPLMQDVYLLGFLVLARPMVSRYINWEDRDLVKTAGRQAATHIAQLMATQALTEARELYAFSKLAAFVIHDLKNVIAQLSLIVANADKHKENPEFVADAIRTVDNSVAKMNRLMAQLRQKSSGAGTSVQKSIDLAEVIEKVVKLRSGDKPEPVLESNVDRPLIFADQDRLAAVLTHIVQNAQEATTPDGSVVVRLRRVDKLIAIEIEDDGSGMDSQFVNDRLFRPFASTKGDRGMGIGAFECREYIRELGGTVEVESRVGVGTKFTIFLPVGEQSTAGRTGDPDERNSDE